MHESWCAAPTSAASRTRNDMREYADVALPRIEQQLTARVPIYAEVEALTLSFSLQRMREWLGPDHPVVRALLAKDSPRYARNAPGGGDEAGRPHGSQTAMGRRQGRRQRFSRPMIALARSLDANSRALRKQFEDEVEAPISAASEKIAGRAIQGLRNTGVTPTPRSRCA